MRTAAAVSAILVLAAAVTSAAGDRAGRLEGSRWSVQVTPDDEAVRRGEKPFADVLVFAADKVALIEGEKAGFAPSPYALRKSGGKLRFATVQVSPSEGKSAWSGEARAGTISGTLVRTRPDGSVLRYRFEGKDGETATATAGETDRSAARN